MKSAESVDRIETWEEAECLMDEYADLVAERAKAQLDRDAELAKVLKLYEPDIARLNSRLSTLHSQLESFVDAHKPEFKAAPDGDGRSYEHAGVIIGFRKLLDKVALPRGDAKKEVSLGYLQQYRPEFVRSKPEFDLVKLLAALKDGDTALVKALGDHDIKLKPGKDEFFLKLARQVEG